MTLREAARKKVFMVTILSINSVVHYTQKKAKIANTIRDDTVMTTQPIHLTIQDSTTDDRLDLALAKLLPDYSRSQLKSWIDAGNVLLNGKPAKGKIKVKFGNQIAVTAIA